MPHRDPNIIRSGLSRTIVSQGLKADVGIYRLEDGPDWSLEVVDQDGTSTVWDELFPTDQTAFEAFQEALQEEGLAGLLGRSNILPFRAK